MGRRVTLLDSNDLARIQVVVDRINSTLGDIEELVSEIEAILDESQNVEGPN